MSGTIDDMRKMVRAQCEAEGISGAKGLVRAYEHDKFLAGVALTWVDEYERKEASDRENLQRVLNEKALEAAQRAAETSALAAEASRVSARWTMWAAIVAAVSTVVSLAQAISALFK